jgi:nitrogen regulatory protein PII
MREIKAYIRPEKADDVVHALDHAEIGHLLLSLPRGPVRERYGSGQRFVV